MSLWLLAEDAWVAWRLLPAEWERVPLSGRADHRANRLDDRLWLTQGNGVTRLLGDHLAAPLRQAGLVTLKPLPFCIRADPGRHDDDGNGQSAATGSDLGRGL